MSSLEDAWLKGLGVTIPKYSAAELSDSGPDASSRGIFGSGERVVAAPANRNGNKPPGEPLGGGSADDLGRAATDPAPAPNQPAPAPRQPTPTPQNKSDIGSADTDPAPNPASGKSNDKPLGDTAASLPQVPRARQNPPVNDAAADVVKKQRRPVVAGKEPPFPRRPGDGKVVSMKDALTALRKGEAVVVTGVNIHRIGWQEIIGMKGEPPAAYQLDGGIRIDETKLSPDDFGAYFEAEAFLADKRLKRLRVEARDIRGQLNAKNTRLSDADRPRLGGKLREVDEGIAEIEARLQRLATRLEAMPEMEGFRGKDPGETFKAAREKFLKRTGALKKLAGALGLLVGAFSIFMEIKGILEADTPQEAMDRVVNIARGVKDQAITTAVLIKFFPKGPPGVSLLLNWCGTQDCPDDAEKLQQAAENAKKEALDEAVRGFLVEMHPELFVKGPNGTYPEQEKIWKETRKQFEEAFENHQKELVATRAKQLADRRRPDAFENGLYDQPVNPFLPKDEGADSTDQERAKTIDAAVIEANNEGYLAGRAQRDAIWKRANDLGLKDAKSGKPVGMEEIPKWPEIQTTSDMSDSQVAARTTFLNKLLEVYLSAFEAAGGKISGAENKLTGGEMAARDQQAAAQKRAKEYGLADGKKGKRLRGDEIQTWREVLAREGAERAALLHELIEIYNKAFASVAPANTAAAGDGKTSGRELVARDKKAAALKRARELGTSDGKLGQKLSAEKIQAWPEVGELEGPDRGTFLHQLLDAYNKAFDAVPKKTGPTAKEMVVRDKKDAAIKRAREQGTRDGKAGEPVNIGYIQAWDVFTELEGPARDAFLNELLTIYNKAFHAVPVRLTASQMIERDKKAAAVQRAREWGLKDGKAGKISDMKVIGTWDEVTAIEPTARGPFIAELLGVYSKARAEASGVTKAK